MTRTRSSLLGILTFSAVLLPLLSSAEQGDDNPTGVTGIYNGNVTTAASYDPYTGNAVRAVDDLVVPGAVGAYPLKFSRYFNSHCSYQEQFPIGGHWRFAYLGYEYSQQAGNYYVAFPDGRAINFTPGQVFGVMESLDLSAPGQVTLYLSDGGQVHFTRNGDGVYPADKITDPYGQVTTITTKVVGTTQTTTILEPGGRYLLVAYDSTGSSANPTQVQWFDGLNPNPVETITYGWADQSFPHGSYHVLTDVYYGDGTQAHYNYTEGEYNGPPLCSASPPVPDGYPMYAAILSTCDDPRFAGPMHQLAYVYQSSGNYPVTTRIKSENRLVNSQPGEVVSSVADDSARLGHPTETRGDGAQRTFTYNVGCQSPKCPNPDGTNPCDAGPQPLDGKLASYTDFRGNTIVLSYSQTAPAAGFISQVQDANLHVTQYTRSGTFAVTQIKYPPTGTELNGSTITQTYTNNTYPYFLASRTDELGHTTTYTRDSNNRITEKDYPVPDPARADGSTAREYETFVYNPFGEVLTHRMKNGAYQHFNYDTRGLLLAKTNPTWDSNWSHSLANDPRTSYTYYTSAPWTDRVYTETDPRGYQTVYEYDRMLDSNGQSSGDSSTAAAPGRGLVTKISYPADTHNGAITGGTYKSLGYDKWGNKVWDENELRQRTTYAYDEFNRLVSTTTPSPINGTTTYDYKGSLSSQYLHTTNSAYSITDPTGITTANTFDANWRKTSTTAGSGTSVAATTTFDYDNKGNPTRVTDPNGHATTTDYDPRDRKWHITDALGNQTIFGYDAASNVISITRPDQTVEVKTYDQMNRILTDAQPHDTNVSLTTKFIYYAGDAQMAGELYQAIDPKNQAFSFVYDPSGLKTQMNYPADQADNSDPAQYQTWTYDSAKNVVARRTVNGVAELFGYDSRNREITETWSNSADWSAFNYDAAGREIFAQNPNSTVTRAYDAAGRLTSDSQQLQILPINAVSRKTHANGAGTYDVNLPLIGTPGVECRSGGATNNHQIVVTFPRAVTFNGVTVTTGVATITTTTLSPDSTQLTINLTGVANAQTITLAISNVSDGNVTNNVNIGMGLLLGDITGNGIVSNADVSQCQSQVAAPVSTSNFRSDVNVNGVITNGDASIVQGQVGASLPTGSSLTQPGPTNPAISTQYAYDAAGRDTRLYANGPGASYDYTFVPDPMGRFQSIYTTGTNTELFRYSYDAASNETQRLNVQTNVAQVYGRDALNRMTSRSEQIGTASPFASETYTYDPLRPGFLTSVTREDNTRDAFGYYLDAELASAQYRLQNNPPGSGTWTNPQRSVSYAWDNAGNRQSVADSAAGTFVYSTTARNEYISDGTNPITPGNEHETANYLNVSYKYMNDRHLMSVSGTDVLTGSQSNYQLYYDALGRCVVRALNGATTYYIYDGDKSILEYSGWTSPSATNLYGKAIDEIVMRTDYTHSSNQTFYYQDDHEGSITQLTDASGAVLESYRYDAFGKPTIYAGPSTANQQLSTSGFGNRFMFTGREYVANFAIYEYRNRAYHPGLGRFMTEDPKLFDAKDHNLFRYCNNDPEDLTDPMGLDITSVDNMAVLKFRNTEEDRMGVEKYQQYQQAQHASLQQQLSAGYPAGAESSTAAGPAEPEVKAEPGERRLGYSTVDKGKDFWTIRWGLTKPSEKSGYVVQEVVSKDAAGQSRFWEAWGVASGSRFTLIRDYNQNPWDDRFAGPPGATVHASARFYEGLPTSALHDFHTNSVRAAGQLPATTHDPHLPTDNATAPVERTWEPEY